MRMAMLIAVVVLVPGMAALAQPSVPFQDVPPWHWAFEAVQRTALAGIFVGYPAVDRDLAINAVTQVYDAFVHAAHPRAREWAERFLINLPVGWPQPLQQSRLVSFRLEQPRVDIKGERGAISVVAVIHLRRARGVAEARTPLRLEVRKDAEGRWRVNYADLAAAQPEVFK